MEKDIPELSLDVRSFTVLGEKSANNGLISLAELALDSDPDLMRLHHALQSLAGSKIDNLCNFLELEIDDPLVKKRVRACREALGKTLSDTLVFRNKQASTIGDEFLGELILQRDITDPAVELLVYAHIAGILERQRAILERHLAGEKNRLKSKVNDSEDRYRELLVSIKTLEQEMSVDKEPDKRKAAKINRWKEELLQLEEVLPKRRSAFESKKKSEELVASKKLAGYLNVQSEDETEPDVLSRLQLFIDELISLMNEFVDRDIPGVAKFDLDAEISACYELIKKSDFILRKKSHISDVPDLRSSPNVQRKAGNRIGMISAAVVLAAAAIIAERLINNKSSGPVEKQKHGISADAGMDCVPNLSITYDSVVAKPIPSRSVDELHPRLLALYDEIDGKLAKDPILVNVEERGEGRVFVRVNQHKAFGHFEIDRIEIQFLQPEKVEDKMPTIATLSGREVGSEFAPYIGDEGIFIPEDRILRALREGSVPSAVIYLTSDFTSDDGHPIVLYSSNVVLGFSHNLSLKWGIDTMKNAKRIK